MRPHPRNLCGGNYQDWLEVMLLSECNGRCAWCIEKGGYHPSERVGWTVLRDKIVRTGKSHIHLLGGEPFLYVHLHRLVDDLVVARRDVYVTTNGSRLASSGFLSLFAGVNVSVHHHDLQRNAGITGIWLDEKSLSRATRTARHLRFNANLIRGQIDNPDAAQTYVAWAQRIGAGSVRFAELKQDDEAFVDAHTVFPNRPLPDDPFTGGCSQDIEIDGMPVNVRLMCGLQTPHRARPECPEQMGKAVLYYDGTLYDGWQRQREMVMDQTMREKMQAIRHAVRDGKLTQEQAWEAIDQAVLESEREKALPRRHNEACDGITQKASHNCQY